jgi:hypothetical protein
MTTPSQQAPISLSTAAEASTKFNENFRKFMAGMSKKKPEPTKEPEKK